MNGFILPERQINRLNEASSYFGDAFKDMVLSSIEENMSNLPASEIQVLQNKINKESRAKEVLENSIEALMESQKDFEMPVSFMDRLRKINPTYVDQFIFESESATDKDTIEGDGDTPESEEPAAEEPQEANMSEEEILQHQQLQAQPTPEQNLELELEQTDSKFVTVILYDKIVEILGSIKTIKENMSSSKSESELDMYTTLEKYESYLEILNELIFVMDINTIYYNVVNIIIEVNDLLNKYLISTKVKVVNSKDSTSEEKDNAINDLKINNDEEEETNDDIEDMDKVLQ